MTNGELPLEMRPSPCYTQTMGLTEYIDAAIAVARFKTLDDGTIIGEIPGFQGVWSQEKTLKKSRAVLREVLEDWLVLKLRSKDPLPSVRGKRLSLPALVRA